jgi:hypothetical protein
LIAGVCCRRKANISIEVLLNRNPFKNVSGLFFLGCIAVGGLLLRKHTYASIKNWLG